MNMNFFNPRKSLRTFQSGGSIPQREKFNSEEEFQAAMEIYLNSIGTPSVAPVSVAAPVVQATTPVTQQTQAIPGYQGASIVDFLKSMGVDSSKANRKKLAALSGDSNYDMSGSDNQALMEYVKKNAQGKDKIRNSDGNIVSLDGAGQVLMTIAGLNQLNKTGSVSGKKPKADNFLREGTPEYNARVAEFISKPTLQDNNMLRPKTSNTQSINFLNKDLNFGDSSSYETIQNYDRTNKDNLGFFKSLTKGTTEQIDFPALREIAKAIKNKSGKIITSDGRKVDYSNLSNIDKEKLQLEIAKYKRDSYTF